MNKCGIKVYEPRDIDKGNIARALFSIVTRYYNFKSMENYKLALMVTNFTNDEEATKTVSVNDTQTKPAIYRILEDLL
jgi:endonuclease I